MNTQSLSLEFVQSPGISAIYYALLQCGYDFYMYERSEELCALIRGFACGAPVPGFFLGVKQNTCEVYPYWPRAAILETATNYLDEGSLTFSRFDEFKNSVMNAPNISEEERGASLWSWLYDFPSALNEVLALESFVSYIKFECGFLAEYKEQIAPEAARLLTLLERCAKLYGSAYSRIQLLINPIKCVYSSDYHINGTEFIYSSGALRADSVLHEFLHHIVHPHVIKASECILAEGFNPDGIDDSYYLSGSDAGKLNAFEEYAVRRLTYDILCEEYPADIDKYLRLILNRS